MELLVRNLSRNVTEKELLELFEAEGTVQSCSLVLDASTGRSKGFGFVEMPKVGEAKRAIKALNGKQIDDIKLRVKKAEEKPEQQTEEKTKEKAKENTSKEADPTTSKRSPDVWGKPTSSPAQNK
jgi:RNA recognition motif-containing protein